MAEAGESSKNQSSIAIQKPSKTFKCADYNVAGICALRETELLMTRLLLDEENITPSFDTQYDQNTYVCGRVGDHRVVVACLPS